VLDIGDNALGITAIFPPYLIFYLHINNRIVQSVTYILLF